MARFFSRSGRTRRRQNSHSLYLAGAVIGFIVVVTLLFRGDSSTPQDTKANAMGVDPTVAEEPARETLPLAAEVNPSLASAGGEVSPERPAPAPAPQTPPPAVRSVQSLPVAPEPVANAKVEAVVAQAMALLRTQPRQVVAARDKLNETLSLPLTPAQEKAVKAEMAALSEEWLFGPAAFAGDTLCDTYTVKRGDLLQVIGRRHKVPFEILMKINNIPRPQSLQAGKAIKVINGPFHAKVSRTTFTLDLYLRDTYVRSFKVGLGRPGYETPTGLWRVQEGGKLEKPTWTDPDSGRLYKASDPDYPLGSRWIALDGVSGAAKGRTGFAIHGTKEPGQIGAAGSRGCIRMYNGEAILLYNMLFPLYSKVEVFD